MHILIRLMPICGALSLMAGCSGAVRSEDPAAPGASPPAQAQPSTGRGTPYTIDSDASELRVLVYRGGTLARLGHNHVIASRGLHGELSLADPLSSSTLTVTLPLASLVVDDPALRAEEGDDFPDALPASAREGTRDNMLGTDLLDASRYAGITLTLAGVSGVAPDLILSMDARVRDQVRRLELPVELQIGEATLTATGQTTVTHSQLGLTPFSVMLGALRVEDAISLKYRLVATRVGTAPPP